MKNLILLLAVAFLFLTCQSKKSELANRSQKIVDSTEKSLTSSDVKPDLTLTKTLQYESGASDYVKIRLTILPNNQVRFLFYLYPIPGGEEANDTDSFNNDEDYQKSSVFRSVGKWIPAGSDSLNILFPDSRGKFDYDSTFMDRHFFKPLSHSSFRMKPNLDSINIWNEPMFLKGDKRLY
jgi:uncharacterized protein YcfL